MRLVLAVLVAGCVTEHDPDVFVTLPVIEQACLVLDAARVDIDVATVQGEHFTVSSTYCSPQLAGQAIAGFEVELARVADGLHRLDARVTTSTGALLGSLSQPFDAAGVAVVTLGRADLPGWPTAAITLAPPACEDTLHVVAIPAGETKPVVETDVPCATPIVNLPRGDTKLVTRTTLAGGCVVATAELFAFDDATTPLALAGSCP